MSAPIDLETSQQPELNEELLNRCKLAVANLLCGNGVGLPYMIERRDFAHFLHGNGKLLEGMTTAMQRKLMIFLLPTNVPLGEVVDQFFFFYDWPEAPRSVWLKRLHSNKQLKKKVKVTKNSITTSYPVASSVFVAKQYTFHAVIPGEFTYLVLEDEKSSPKEGECVNCEGENKSADWVQKTDSGPVQPGEYQVYTVDLGAAKRARSGENWGSIPDPSIRSYEELWEDCSGSGEEDYTYYS